MRARECYSKRKRNRKKRNSPIFAFCQRNNQGTTLIELVVTFALLSILMVSVSQVISSGTSLYNHVKGVSYGKQVTDTLIEKIAGEIQGAQSSFSTDNVTYEPGVGEEALDTKTLVISADHNKISLIDKTGSRIYISTLTGDNPKLLNIHYYAAISTDEEGNTKIKYQPVDWTFDQAMYMGYEICSLQFLLAQDENSEYPKNIIKISLTIKSDRYGEYTQKRYVECYNFITPEDFALIEQKGTTPAPSEPDPSQPGPSEPGPSQPDPSEPEPTVNLTSLQAAWNQHLQSGTINNGQMRNIYNAFTYDNVLITGNPTLYWRPLPIGYTGNKNNFSTIYYASLTGTTNGMELSDAVTEMKSSSIIMVGDTLYYPEVNSKEIEISDVNKINIDDFKTALEKAGYTTVGADSIT